MISRSLVQSRQQIVEHMRSNRQRTDPQKTEIQQRRNALTRRIKVWRVAQAVYMPQVSVNLSQENSFSTSDENGSDDAPKLDDLMAETWALSLPSAIPEGDRLLCHKGVTETEQVLRLAQLQDNLDDLRQFRRALRNLRLYFKTNIAGEGQKTQTKSRAAETSVNSRIRRAVTRYRTAYHALSELDPTGDWRAEYRELRDEDNRGPLKEIEESGTGDGRYTPSWIWVSPSAMELPGEGTVAEQREVNETARHEWMTCRARADRWMEEEELLLEEMRRVITYLLWKSRDWLEKVGTRAGSRTPDVQCGVDAYARKQANIYHELAVSFGSQWQPYLDAWGFDSKWARELPWVVPPAAKLPKRFSPPENVPPVPPTTDSPPGAEELGEERKHADVRETRHEDGVSDSKDQFDEHSDHEDTDEVELGFDSRERESDDEDWESDDESDGYSDKGGESDNEFGFEYDDEYMT